MSTQTRQQNSPINNFILVLMLSLTVGATAQQSVKSIDASATSANPLSKSPRLVVYVNTNTDPVLAHAHTLPYTHYILAFLIPDGNAAVQPSKNLRKILAEPEAIVAAQAAGKKVMISLGGGTIGAKDWLSLGQNATAVAQSVGLIVEQYGLDGVDLDIEAVPYEHRSSFQPYADAAIALTRALATRLPGKLLSHAPQPPYLCAPGSKGCPPDSLYATILNATGEQISWLNMQYYSNPPVTASEIDELASYRSIVSGWPGFAGLPARRLVLGKPYSSKVSGYQPIDQVITDLLDPLMAEYGEQFGGFMAWEFNQDPDGSLAAAISSALNNRLRTFKSVSGKSGYTHEVIELQSESSVNIDR